MGFRENLQGLRSERGMTQEQLAQALGVSRQAVTKWEAEKSYPEMDKLIAMCALFGCTFDELVLGEVPGAFASPDTVVAAPDDRMRDFAAIDAFEAYDQERVRFALMVPSGVACIIVGATGAALLDALVHTALSEFFSTAWLLGCLVAGLALIISSAMHHAAFATAHPVIDDLYTAEQHDETDRRFLWELLGGLASILLLGVVGMEALTNLWGAPEGLAAAWLLVCVAVGVWLIVSGGMLKAGMGVEEYNRAVAEGRAEAAGHPSPRSRVTGALCGAVMIVATIFGLTMLFVPGYQQPFSWLPWPVGGLLCALVACLTKAFMPDATDGA